MRARVTRELMYLHGNIWFGNNREDDLRAPLYTAHRWSPHRYKFNNYFFLSSLTDHIMSIII